MQTNKQSIEILNESTQGISIDLIKYNENTLIYKLSGKIDTYNSNSVAKAIKQSLLNNTLNKAIIDMKEVSYMSSTGIGVFVELLTESKILEINLFLINIQSKVEEVFKLLGFYSFFNILEDYNEIDIADTKLSIFPISIRCPHCEVEVKLPKSGRFKCSSCGDVIGIDGEGNILEE